MRKLFTLILFLTQFGTFAQTLPGDSLAFPVASDTVAQPTKLLPLIRNLVRAELKEQPSRELKMLTRSAIVMSGVSTAGLITYKFGDEPLRNFALSNRSEITTEISQFLEPLGRSRYMFWASGGFYASGLALRNPKLQRAGLLTVSSLLINDMVTHQLKDEFQRRRPDITDQNHYFEGGEGGRHHASFPSGHTSTAFTFATAVATVYKDNSWVPPVAYSMATLVGLSRIHDNKHWATDIMAGALVGYLNAKTAHFMLKQLEKQLGKRDINLYVLPRVAGGTVGMGLGGSF